MREFIVLVSYLTFIILVINVIYIFIFSIAGKIGKIEKSVDCESQTDFVVFIPAYKEDLVIVPTVKQALEQNYPKEKYKIVVIAESLQDETLLELKNFPIEVIEVKFENSSKAKALKEAIRQLDRDYEGIVILDADNIMSDNFLKKISAELKAGKKAVQGHRVAKNQNNSMAILDAASEEINNHIFRRGHAILGFSSALIGSGMAFDFSYFKNIIFEINSVGEDKEIELVSLKQKIKIFYQDEAYIYDEKVQNISTFRVQRRRWFSTQLYFFNMFFLPAIFQLFKENNWDYFNKVFQAFLLPRLMLIFFTGIYFAFSVFMPSLTPSVIVSGTIFLLCITSIVIAIPKRLINQKLFKAIFLLPIIFFEMVLILFRLRNGCDTFSHTPHNVVTGEFEEDVYVK